MPTPTLYRRRRGGFAIIAFAVTLLLVVAAGVWAYRSIVVPVAAVTSQIIPTPGPVRTTATARASISVEPATTVQLATSAVTTTSESQPSHTAQATPPAPTSTPLPTLGGTRRINILLLGSDTDAKFAGLYITQIMIVATIDPVNHTVGLLSIPRDFWVPIPGHGIGKIQVAYQLGEVDHPNGGGIALTRQTIEDDFGIHIDYYAWVGLEGFIKVIDTAGGVNIDVLHPILDDAFPDDIQANGKTTTVDIFASRRLFIPAGVQHLDGTSALQYVRSRHADLIGDFGRSARQQQVLLNLREKIQQPGTILKIPEYLADVQGYVKTDMPVSEIIATANFLREYHTEPVNQVVLMPPTYSGLAVSSDGQDIVQPNWPKVHAEIAHLFREPQDGSAAQAPVTPPHVVVENATSIGGLAGRATTYLRSLGYTVDAATTAPAIHEGSVVTYFDPQRRAEADLLAQAFAASVQQGASSDRPSATADIVVLLGANYGTFDGF